MHPGTRFMFYLRRRRQSPLGAPSMAGMSAVNTAGFTAVNAAGDAADNG